MTAPRFVTEVFRAAEALRRARRVLVVTGAGMSAESGVPTYRDPEGLWTRLEPFESLGVQPARVAHQDGYERDPEQAWGVHEWLRRTMSAAEPHAGYGVVTRILTQTPEAFLLTTNVDGLHARAGVPAVQRWERYGSLFKLQCASGCRAETWVDERPQTGELDARLRCAPPQCPFCDGPSRPAVQLDHDSLFVADAVGARRYEAFVARKVDVCLAIGTTLWLTWPDELRPTVVSINPNAACHEPYPGCIALTSGARHALVGIEWALAELGRSVTP